MSKRRAVGLDVIRIVSICLVCVIHANVIFLAGDRHTDQWLLGTILTCICYVSVPLFFMLSGALLLEKKEDNLPQRLLKQLIPFVIWSIIYTCFKLVYHHTPFSLTAFAELLREPADAQFWFMYTLLGIYLLLPVLRIITAHGGKWLIEYILKLWIVFSVVQPTLSHYFSIFRLSVHVDLVLSEGYIGYFFLGYYFNTYSAEKEYGAALFLGGLAVLLVHIFMEVRVLSDVTEGRAYVSYFTPSIACMAAGAYQLLGKIDTRSDSWKRFLKSLSRLSFGVYYVHMLVLRVFEYLGFTGKNNFALCELKALLVIAGSFIVASLLSKIPVVRVVLMGVRETKNT